MTHPNYPTANTGYRRLNVKGIVAGLFTAAFALALTPLALAVAAPAHATDMFSCGNGTYVNGNTTCPFAHYVTDAWFASPLNQISAWSPALGSYVMMDCAAVPGGEVCRGGNNAVVVFHP
jgi:hypothetical protein